MIALRNEKPNAKNKTKNEKLENIFYCIAHETNERTSNARKKIHKTEKLSAQRVWCTREKHNENNNK